MKKAYTKSIFINYPIDQEYRKLLHPIIFTILKCEFFPRCAEEAVNCADFRLGKIIDIINECKYGIHDISRTKLDDRTKLPRFNMPFELGIFYAAKNFGGKKHGKKNCLIFEEKEHTYEKYISDIKGLDIMAHNSKPEKVIKAIRDWLTTNSKTKSFPDGRNIGEEYSKFKIWAKDFCPSVELNYKELIYDDYISLVLKWLDINNK